MGAAKSLCGVQQGGVKGQIKKKRNLTLDEMRPMGNVYCLAVCLDYEGYPADEVGGCCALTCSPDVQRFLDLGYQCGLDQNNVVHLKDDPKDTSMWPDRDRVLAEAKAMGERCGPGDTFLLFYAGHGDAVVDDDFNEEADGMDEVLCTMKPNGDTDFLRDDDLAEILSDFDDKVTIIVITDCCHSGTICDLDTGDWGDKWVIHLAAVQDHQCAVDLGKGGAFTSAMFEALEKMVEQGKPHPAVVDVYNAAQKGYGEMFEAYDQSFSFNTTPAVNVDEIAWPFYPEDAELEVFDTALDS